MVEAQHQFFSNNTDVNKLVVALESTSFLRCIANYLSSCETLMPFYTFTASTKLVANYKIYVGLGKRMPLTLIIADFAHQVALLLHLGVAASFLLCSVNPSSFTLSQISYAEKTLLASNIFLKFNEFSILDDDKQPFSSNYGTTASAILTDFYLLKILQLCHQIH